MSNDTILDVVICTHNNAPLLDRTLDALASQQTSALNSWSVTVVDNLCTDDTLGVVEKHVRAATIPLLRAVTEPTLGLTHARLRGVHSTSAPWIAYVDDDCLLQQDWIERAIAFLREHPECGAMGGKVILDWETPPPAYFHAFEYSYAAQERGEAPKEVDCLAGAGMIVSRRALAECGWLEGQWMTDRVGKRLVSGGDVEMALRLGSTGRALWYYPGCRLQHVIPARRISPPYLRRLNYGLGMSQTFADAMSGPSSFARWLPMVLKRNLRASRELLVLLAKALAGRRTWGEVLVVLSFLRGRWAGVFALQRMKNRDALLGCAAKRETD
jgi:glycosyltransferase involved in cell wall biosynthesis